MIWLTVFFLAFLIGGGATRLLDVSSGFGYLCRYRAVGSDFAAQPGLLALFAPDRLARNPVTTFNFSCCHQLSHRRLAGVANSLAKKQFFMYNFFLAGIVFF